MKTFPHTTFKLAIAGVFALASLPAGATSATAAPAVTPAEARAIAKDAYIYGFPIVDNYRIQYSYFVDKDNPEYKGAWNEVHNVARVFTPEDKAIQTPNSDTPYSFLGVDLRTEPLVISVPAVPKDRYYSLQFVDMYTFNFAYVGSRATGDDAAKYLLVGPRWHGKMPKGIKSVIHSDTQFAFILYRTQLFGPNDINEVKKIQADYKVEPLSRFEGTSPPPPAPAVDFIKPLSTEAQKTSPDFFSELNFILQFCPTDPSETGLMKRFARIGAGAGKHFDVTAMSAEQQEAVKEGMADAWKALAKYKAEVIDTGKKSSADGFGTRAHLHNDYLMRMASAAFGIYGNSKAEAIYPTYFVDSEGKPLDAASNRYTVHFAPGQLPPVNSFWSLTMYKLPSNLLTENPIHRYLINSEMLPELVRGLDGGVTLYIQHESPGKAKEPNWLPAPKGPFWMVLRFLGQFRVGRQSNGGQRITGSIPTVPEAWATPTRTFRSLPMAP